MSKNRSTWASLLSVVLAMVLMAGLAVTAFAETEVSLTPSGTPVEDRQDLVDVLNGEDGEGKFVYPSEGVNYDVDGNGIVEMADLDAFDGAQVDLLPNGEEDMLNLPLDPEYAVMPGQTAMQTLFVNGDSSAALRYETSTTVELALYEPVALNGHVYFKFDMFAPDGVSDFEVTFVCGDDYEYVTVPVEVTDNGWTTYAIDLTALDSGLLGAVWNVNFGKSSEEAVYIDNMHLDVELTHINASFSSSYDNAGEPIEVIPGTPYGELPQLVHTFYTFEGWYLDQGYTQKVTADTIVEADTDHTLYAKWSWIAGEEGRVTVASAGNNSYTLTLDGSGYKQIRFRFNVKSVTGNFSMDYADGDSAVTNNPIVTIVDENDNIVHPSKVEAGEWYTAIIFGGTVVTDAGTVTAGNICSTGTLTFAADAKVQIEHLEALSGQFGLQATTRTKATWSMADLTNYGYSYGYHYVQNATNKWDTRIALSIPSGRYTKMSYDFLITNLQSGKENPWYETSLPLTIRERDNSEVVLGAGDALTPDTWYTAEITLNKTGSDYLYFYGQQYNGADNNARPTFDMYIANVYYEGDGEMIDNVGAGNALILNKAGADGTFFTSPVSRDRDYGTLYVVEDSASWTDRVLKITLKDESKELIQVDFRFLVSKNTRGKDVAPTLKASTTISGSLSEAQYIILDENDVPVTSLEAGKWYRMFITANGNTTFGLVPATTGEVKLQVKDLIAFNSDELATTMTSGNTAAGNLSAVLSRFGKMEYAYAGTAENTVNIRLNSDLYKQVRFSFQLKNRSTILSVAGANLTITDSSDAVVNALNLQVGQWYTATITNSGDTLSKDLVLKVAGRTSLIIKDLAAYQSLEIPAENAPSTIFNGLDADEMMIAGFIGPYDEDYYEKFNYDQKIGPLPSLAQDDIFKLLADAGINYITDNGLSYAGAEKESAQRILRLAAKYGINYMLQTPDIFSIGVSTGTQNVNGNTQHIYAPNVVTTYPSNKAMLDELTQYASFGGSFLRDEPGSDLFEAIRDARAAVKQYNAANGTAVNVFANLLPGVGSFRWTNGKTPPGGYTISNWQGYVECFEGVTDFDYLMFDMYPFAGGEGIIEGVFIEYASRLATIAKNTGKMWMGCVQVGGGDVAYSGKRVCNENEMNWDVNVLLAMGAKGLNYYTLVSAPYLGGTVEPTDSGYTDHSLLTTRGEKTNYYDWAAKINKQVKAVDHVMMNAEQIGLIFVGDQLTYTGGTGNNNSPYNYESIADSEHLPLITKAGTYGKKYSDVKLSNVTGDHVMIGAFNYDGKTALYVVNNDIVADATGDTGIDTIQLTFNSSYSYEIIQDGLTTWQTGAIANLTLELGHGALIVVHEGAVSMDATVIYDLNYETSVPAPAPVVLPLGSTYPELPVLTRDFYTFEGWYLNADGTGNPVKAGDTLAVNGSHVLYAKWTYKEDDSLLQPSYTTETSFTNVSRQYVDGVETIVYTTSGMGTPDKGDYQRRLSFTVVDTTKEVMKFRFKFVAHNDANGNPLDFTTMWLYANGLDATNSAGYVVVDENGEPAMGNMEVGQWYTFYGLTKGKSTVSLYPATIGAGYVDMTIHIQDRELLDYEPGVGLTDYGNSWYGNLAPYQDNEGNWLYHNRSFTGEHHGNTAEYRRTHFVFNDEYEYVSFEFRFNVATYDAVDADPVNKLGFAYLNGVTYFDENGIPVTAANMELGKWYRAVVDLATEGTGWNANWYATMADISVANGNILQVDMDYRNLVGMGADTNPITIASRDKNNLVTTNLGGGMYNINTITASSPGTAAWQWAALVTAPDNTHTNMAVTFRFNAAYAADGVTPIDASMSIWRGSNASSGVTAQIYDVETGEMVSSDNGLFKALEIGKWYTVVITNPAGDLQTQYRLTPCYKYSGAAKFSIDVTDRVCCAEDFRNGYVVTTPGSMANPAVAYTTVDGWHQYIPNSGSAITAENRSVVVTIPTDGAIKLSYEAKINSISGDATSKIGLYGAVGQQIYDLETGELVGDGNAFTWEIGKWYKVVTYKSNNGNLGTKYTFGYAGDAAHNAGNASVSFRNFEAIYPQIESVSFDLNYTGAVNDLEPMDVIVGSTYGELPAPTRAGYTFGGWYTDAACSGSAVTAQSTVTGAATLYAKWTIGEDTSLLKPSYNVETTNTAVSRDFIDGKETIIFTTEGKTLINTGWQRRMEFTNGDTSKEIVKFRFKYVSNNNASGTEVAPALNYLAGGLADTNFGHFVVTDGNGNVVNNLEVGTWYTFWGLTQGNTSLVLYPCNTTEQLRMTLYIQDRELLDYEPAISLNQTAHAYYGSTAPYQDAEGNWLYHHRSFTGEHHNNATDYRKTFITTGETYDVISFEFRYNVATHIAAGAEPVTKLGFAYLNGATYFDMNGNPVTAANMTLGNWYKAYVQVASEFDGGWNSGWFAAVADINGNTANGVSINIDMDYRNIVGYAADTNPITITSRDKNNLVTTYLGDGMYNINTITASSPGTAAWQWAAMVTAPDNTHTNMAVTFRFNAAYAADGVTPIDASMSIWRGSNASSGVTAQIYDAQTGEMVSSDNGLFKALEIGKWYTVVITNPAGALQTQYRLTPCYKYSGAAKFSIDIADRLVYTSNGITMTTPQGLADPAMRYTEEDGWHYYIANNGATLTAEQRQAYVQIPQDGANQLTYEVKINNVSGNATPKVGIITGNIRYYEMDGTLVGTQNSVSLETGKWYKVEMSKNEGANLGTSWLFGFIGDASNNAGNVSASFRNFNVVMPGNADVSFDLNYTGAENAPATIVVAEGSAYGELPTPTRTGYVFGGWYTDAACSGSAVTAETTVTTSHTLYAKWTMTADTNPVGVVVRDATNLSMSVDYVDGRHVYTTTTRGVSNPGTGAWQWGTGIEVPLGTTHWAVTFRIMEAYQADGETPIERPTMSAWQKNLTSGTTAMIFDAETGAVVSSDNGSYKNTQCLELEKWYTIVSNVPVAENTRHYLYPCQQYSGAAIITMEIAERAVYTEEVTFKTPWAVFADPVLSYTDGAWSYRMLSSGSTSATQENKQLQVAMKNDGVYHLSFDFMTTNQTGSATADFWDPNSKTLFYDAETGVAVTRAQLVADKWYTAVYYSGSALSTSAFTISYMGSTTGGLDMYIRNVQTHDYHWGTDSGQDAATILPDVVDGEEMFRYSTENHPINGSEWSRRAQLKIVDTAGDTISLKVKIESVVDSDGNPYANTSKAVIDVNGIDGEVFTDEEGNPVAATNLETGKWYTVTWTGTAAGTYNLWMFTGSPSVHATAYFKDVTVTTAS